MSTELQEALKRSNKITVQSVGEGVLKASFYRTHTKLAEVLSSDETVVGAGFVMPVGIDAIAPDEENGIEGVEGVKVTPKERSDAFRDFVQENAKLFGFNFDPVDRRSADNVFPKTYENAEAVASSARKVTDMKMISISEAIQKKIDKMVEKEKLPAGCKLIFEVQDGITTEVTEEYTKGNVKYAQSKVSVEIGLEDVDNTIVISDIPVFLRSGCIAKPKVLVSADEENGIEEVAFTTTAIHTRLVEAGIFPVIVKPVKEDKVEEGEVAGDTDPAVVVEQNEVVEAQ